MTFIRSKVVGLGSYLPSKVISNNELSRTVDTSDEWIRERTGIAQRHISETETTAEMGVKAARNALLDAHLLSSDIDALIVATSTPNLTLPSTAALISSVLKIKGFAFDVSAACSGFVYGLTIADALLKTGSARRILLVGSERLSKIIDWSDRNTCVLFGDGAGAFILEASEGTGTLRDEGILDTLLCADAREYNLLQTSGGIASTGTAGYIQMNGREVFRHAVIKLEEVACEILKRHSLTGDDIDWFIPHQANARIIDSTAKRLGLASEKIIMTVNQHANTSAASIPLAFKQAVEEKKVKKGDLILLDAMGAGLTWGAVLLRY